LEDGFDIDQMVSEYRALRASIIKLWRAEHNNVSHQDMEDIIRFNEAVDQTIAESVRRYIKRIDHSRNMFLGILGHDLRNPIGAASMCGQLMIAKGTLDPKMRILAAQVIDSTARANIIINDLLDFTRSGVGSGLTVSKELADMGIIAQRLVDEMVAISKGRKIDLDMKGDMQGEWDVARIEQVFSNLIGNALQYSFEGTPIALIIDGTEKNDIKIMVHK
jgi:signal transduction histidine kinase